MKDLNRVIIDSDGDPRTTVVKIDGVDIKGLCSASIKLEVNCLPVIVLEFFGQLHVDMLAKAQLQGESSDFDLPLDEG